MEEKRKRLKQKRDSSVTFTVNTAEQSQHKRKKPIDISHVGPALRAHDLVNNRSEEHDRRHGPFIEGMNKASIIASELCNKNITPEDMYKILMALKLSRIAYSVETDSVTDLCGYAEGLWNYIDGNPIKDL